MIGYVVCFAVGWLLSIGATIMFFAKHDIPAFAILFSLGQVLNITGYDFDLLKVVLFGHSQNPNQGYVQKGQNLVYDCLLGINCTYHCTRMHAA